MISPIPNIFTSLSGGSGNPPDRSTPSPFATPPSIEAALARDPASPPLSGGSGASPDRLAPPDSSAVARFREALALHETQPTAKQLVTRHSSLVTGGSRHSGFRLRRCPLPPGPRPSRRPRRRSHRRATEQLVTRLSSLVSRHTFIVTRYTSLFTRRIALFTRRIALFTLHSSLFTGGSRSCCYSRNPCGGSLRSPCASHRSFRFRPGHTFRACCPSGGLGGQRPPSLASHFRSCAAFGRVCPHRRDPVPRRPRAEIGRVCPSACLPFFFHDFTSAKSFCAKGVRANT